MGRLIKWLFYLVLLGGLGLVVYVYLGPVLGVDFSPPDREIRIPVELNAQ